MIDLLINSTFLLQELFNKIKTAEFTIPEDGRVSEDTRNVIRRLLVTDPAKRLTATQVQLVRIHGMLSGGLSVTDPAKRLTATQVQLVRIRGMLSADCSSQIRPRG
jgi:hypothetical protein